MRRARTVHGRLWTDPEGDGSERAARRRPSAWRARGWQNVPRRWTTGTSGRRLLVVPLLAAVLTAAAPATAGAQPTIAQAFKASCLHAPGASIALGKPVAAGDDLVLVVEGQGYGVSAPKVLGVSDTVNGPWGEMVNRVGASGSDDLNFAVYHRTSAAAPGGLTVNITQAAGGTGASAVVVDVTAGREAGSTFDSQIQAAASRLIAPARSATAGELALGLFGFYGAGQTLTAGAGFGVTAATATCSGAAAVSAPVASTITVTPAATLSEASPYLAGTLLFHAAPAGSCTATVSSMSALSTAVSSAAGGSTICVAPGSYTGMQLGGAHTADVTVEPEPTLDPNGSGKVTIGLSSTVTDGFGNAVAADVAPNSTRLVIHNFYFTGELSLGYGSSNITVSNNNMTEGATVGGGEYINFATSNCKAPNAPSWANCSPLAPVSNVTITGNDLHDNNRTTAGGDDALHTNNFRNLVVTGNEISGMVENNAGGHVDCLQNVFGGSGMTFSYNYEHDNECQGLFLKDGDITRVTVEENLFLRDTVPATNGGSSYSSSQVWNTNGLVVRNNTIWDGKGLTLRCIGSSVSCTATVDHNLTWVLNNGNLGDATVFKMFEDYDMFNTSPFTFTAAATDVTHPNPAFVCGSQCGNGTITGDDYRLSSNPGDIGINWSPAQYTYGPVR